MSEWFSLDASELDEFQKTMDDYGDVGLQTINDVLHGEGAQVIQDKIQNLLPSSGRTAGSVFDPSDCSRTASPISPNLSQKHRQNAPPAVSWPLRLSPA